jgi:transcriptional regulator with XRE-family HTH domain
MKKHQKHLEKKRISIETNVAKVMGVWLKSKRKDKSLNQVRLSQEIGTSQSRISKIESGLLVPDLIDILFLTKILDITDQAFFAEIRGLLEPKQPAHEVHKKQLVNDLKV